MHLALAARIRGDLTALESVVGRAERAAGPMRDQPDSLWVDAAALNLHDLYAGLERLFRLVAMQLDGTLPAGSEWDVDLLRQMGLPLKGVRAAVLSPESVRSLDEYLRFRHVVRNIYSFELDPGQVLPLVDRAGPVFARVRDELLEFAAFLENAGR